MTTINSLSDLTERLGISDQRPTDIAVYESAKVQAWLRMAWNHGKSVGYKEAYDAIRQSTLQSEVDAQAVEAEEFRVRCAKAFRAAQRSKRSGR